MLFFLIFYIIILENFENGNIDSKTGSKRGPCGVGGPPADDDRGCYDPVWPHGGPVWPRFTVDVTIFEVKFDVTVFDVNFVSILQIQS